MLYQASVPEILEAVYACEACREHPSDDCGDSCSSEWMDELPAFGDDYWPACKCCGQSAMLVAPLLRV